MRKSYFLFAIFMFCVQHWASAQGSGAESMARAQLAQRGISEDELRVKLAAKGIRLEGITPEQLLGLQPTIEQVIKEIEAERAAKSSSKPSSTVQPPGPYDVPITTSAPVSTKIISSSEVGAVAAKAATEVKERVQEGATVSEAVAESLNEEGTKSTVTRIYGQDIFRNKTLDVYRTTKDARPTDNYLLGVGDEIGIVIFGASQGDFRYVINEEGYISPPGVGKIFLKGVPFGKAKALLHNRFSRAFVFREDQFVMSLATARTITVNIFGEVENSGSFSISAINTAFNAIAAAGGPNTIGSVRNIKLSRNGKSRNIDVYAFMADPSIKYELFLENNDVIHVPVAEKVVSIDGAITRPSVYELKSGEQLDQLIKFAGGLTPSAFAKRIQVKRYISNNAVLIDVDYEKVPNFELYNGDVVTVMSIPNDIENSVTVTGAVEFPGTYALEKNLDLAALAFKANIKRTARRDMAFVVRTLTDGKIKLIQVNLDEILQGKNQPFLLEPKDQLVVFTQSRYVDNLKVSITGAVRLPKEQPFNKGLKLSEYLLLSGGLREDATDFGYILRYKNSDDTRSYLKINPRKAIEEPNSAANIELNGNDQVRIFSTREFTDDANVKISGAVRSPQSLPFGSAITLSDLIKMAGGLRLDAAKGRIDLYRVALEENSASRTLAQSLAVDDQMGTIGQDIMLEPFDEIIVRTIPDFSLLKKVRIEGEVKYPGEYGLLSDKERITDLIARAGGLTPEAYLEGGTVYRNEDNVGLIVTRMDIAVKKKGSRFDLILSQGDVISVPKSLDIVTIYTQYTNALEVLDQGLFTAGNRINVAYTPNKRARWYVNEFAGGHAKNTSYRRLKVRYPNGHIKKSKDFWLFAFTPKVVPGSKLILTPNAPKKKLDEPEKPKQAKKSVDWDKTLSQVLAFASVIASMALATAAILRI